jgi:deoxyribose-phosphate aldolase
MARRPLELAKTIDHTLLDPHAPPAAVERLCDEAGEHHFASVCVLPALVGLAAGRLRGRDVKIAGLVGFPLGAEGTRRKLADAERCVAEGADELDVVLNVSAMLCGDFRLVRDELAAVVRVVRVRSVNTGRGEALVKVVLECERLGRKRAQLACMIVEGVDADFVCTSAGDPRAALALEHVELLRDRLPERIGVKAAGAITTAEEAADLLVAGAGRIGTRYAVDVVRDGAAARQASPA